jgi:hypothetical protein
VTQRVRQPGRDASGALEAKVFDVQKEILKSSHTWPPDINAVGGVLVSSRHRPTIQKREARIFGGQMTRRDEPSEPINELATWDLRSIEAKSCEVHGSPLQEGLAQIAYGLYDFDERHWAHKMSLFPNANSWVVGGCISGDLDTTQVEFCEQCRRAEDIWQQTKGDLVSETDNPEEL